MKQKANFLFVSLIVIIALIFLPMPISFASGGATIVQSANSSNMATTGFTITLNGVTAGNTLVIAIAGRIVTSPFVITLTDSQSQAVNIISSNREASSATSFAETADVLNALSGTHTITVAITQTGDFATTLYEVSSAGSISGYANGTLSNVVIGISPSVSQTSNSLAIGACGFMTNSPALTWSGASISLTLDASFPNGSPTEAITGNQTGANSAQNFGCASSSGANVAMSLAGAIFNGMALVTTTSTVTGWNFPNWSNCGANGNSCPNDYTWVGGLILLFMPSVITDAVYAEIAGNVDRNVVVLLTLVMLFFGSIIATFANLLPLVTVFIFGTILGLYLWRGRG